MDDTGLFSFPGSGSENNHRAGRARRISAGLAQAKPPRDELASPLKMKVGQKPGFFTAEGGGATFF